MEAEGDDNHAGSSGGVVVAVPATALAGTAVGSEGGTRGTLGGTEKGSERAACLCVNRISEAESGNG